MTSADDGRPATDPVDLALLADYMVGELDELATRRVRGLVDRDPVWADALVALRRADADLRDELGGQGEERMPDDVFDRIMAALPVDELPGGAGPRTDPPAIGGLRGWNALRGGADRPAGSRRPTPPGGLTGGAPSGTAGSRPPGRSGATAPLDRDDRRVPRRQARPAKRRLPMAGLAVLVLAVVAIFGGAITLLNQNTGRSAETTNAGAGAPPADSGKFTDVPGPEAAPTTVDGVTRFASGTDYTFSTLGFYGSLNTYPGPQPMTRGPGGATNFGSGEPHAPGLERLDGPAALDACLAAIAAHLGSQPSSVDYARYLGSPALIVELPGIGQVVAVGPNCGVPGVGADVLAQAPLR